MYFLSVSKLIQVSFKLFKTKLLDFVFQMISQEFPNGSPASVLRLCYFFTGYKVMSSLVVLILMTSIVHVNYIRDANQCKLCVSRLSILLVDTMVNTIVFIVKPVMRGHSKCPCHKYISMLKFNGLQKMQ